MLLQRVSALQRASIERAGRILDEHFSLAYERIGTWGSFIHCVDTHVLRFSQSTGNRQPLLRLFLRLHAVVSSREPVQDA